MNFEIANVLKVGHLKNSEIWNFELFIFLYFSKFGISKFWNFDISKFSLVVYSFLRWLILTVGWSSYMIDQTGSWDITGYTPLKQHLNQFSPPWAFAFFIYQLDTVMSLESKLNSLSAHALAATTQCKGMMQSNIMFAAEHQKIWMYLIVSEQNLYIIPCKGCKQ